MRSHAGRPSTPLQARPALRPAACVLALVLVALAAATPVLGGCGGDADPFAGLYWEPSSGRRVEIRKEGETYRLFYGAAQRPFLATCEGDELRIAEPMGGSIVVRPGGEEGMLELLIAGKTTVLKPLPQHQ